MGIEMDVFELTKEQFEIICQSNEFDHVDSLDWDLDDIGQYSHADEVSVYCNGEEIDISCEIVQNNFNAKGVATRTNRLDTVTELGKFYAIRLWENKGIWYGCKFDGFLDHKTFLLKRFLPNLAMAKMLKLLSSTSLIILGQNL